MADVVEFTGAERAVIAELAAARAAQKPVPPKLAEVRNRHRVFAGGVNNCERDVGIQQERIEKVEQRIAAYEAKVAADRKRHVPGEDADTAAWGDQQRRGTLADELRQQHLRLAELEEIVDNHRRPLAMIAESVAILDAEWAVVQRNHDAAVMKAAQAEVEAARAMLDRGWKAHKAARNAADVDAALAVIKAGDAEVRAAGLRLEELARCGYGGKEARGLAVNEVRKSSTGIANAREAEADVAVEGRVIEGWASVFDDEYEVDGEGPTFVEVVRKGAFRRTLATTKPIIQWLHGTDPAVGKAPIARLDEAREDGRGLYFRGTLLDVAALDHLRAALAAGEVRGASFRFRPNGPAGERWSPRTRGTMALRELLDLAVVEFGPVTFGASKAASVKLRTNRILAGKAARDAELILAGRRRMAAYHANKVEPASGGVTRQEIAAVVDALTKSVEPSGGLTRQEMRQVVAAAITKSSAPSTLQERRGRSLQLS